MFKGRTKKSKDNWQTPDYIFELLDNEFHFSLDPASDQFNYKCKKHYTIAENGLKQNWDNEVAFVNPPYKSKDLWIRKCHQESINSKDLTIVLLIPVTTETKAWYKYIWHNQADEIRFLYKRINFIVPINKKNTKPSTLADFMIGNDNSLIESQENTNSATFPPCLIIYRSPRKYTETKIICFEHR